MPAWTQEQLTAINTRDKTLLVSAAAGSGKTATLTERIIRSLSDSENPVSVDSLLVVTYTKAAASELKQKITKELSRAVKENPDNAHLSRQLYMLPSARICTIDSFYGEILRANCERVGIAPGYRIADGVECELLASSILDGIIDEIYSGRLPEVASAEELSELSECLTEAKHPENMSDIFRSLYKKLESLTEGVEALSNIAELYTDGKAPHISYITDRLSDCASHYLMAIKRTRERFACGSEYEQGFVQTCDSDIEFLQTILCKSDYNSIKNLLENYVFAKMHSKRGETKTDLVFEYDNLRKSMKKDVLSFKTYFLYDEEQLSPLLSDMREMILVLYRVMKEFDRAFTAEKYRIGALSFADVARLAYECLWQNGEPTDIALSLRSSLSAIYIDEYQDVNDIQEKIFEAISREDNRFMVGDIKQSIYRFRHANPDIFTRTKRSLPDLSDDARGACLFMSRNFRSDKAVIDFVNEIFDRVFALCGDSIDYREDDRLVFGKTESASEYRRPEICLINKAPPARHSGDAADVDDDENDDGRISDPRAVALKIRALIDGERLNSGKRIEPGDIAIILKKVKNKAESYAAELKRLGISSKISGEKGFFLSSEVLLAMSLLNSIDNPRRDVYLAGLMTSPLYAFTQEELYEIRSSCPADTLYTSLTLYTERTGDEKCAHFLKSLAHYRRISEGISIDCLLYRLYRETGLFALAKKNGGEDNLHLLYDYARRFSDGEFKGLYSFISFINSIEDMETSFDDKRDGDDSNSVAIITAHSSKGLEYPVVFLANATGDLYKSGDTAPKLHFAKDFGIGIKLRAKDSVALVENPIFDIVDHYKKRADFEEYLRLLYVILTRARERLYIVGTSPKVDRAALELDFTVIHDNLSDFAIRRSHSFMDVILAALGPHMKDEDDFLIGADRAVSDPADETAAPASSGEMNAELYSALMSRFSFKYPYIHETTLPEKLSVSRASPTVLDGTEGEYPALKKEDAEANEPREHLPAFIEGGASDESAKRGIATHYFLQFCDLRRFADTSADEELKTLLRDGFISARDAERVRLSEIRKFRESRLFADMLSAKNLYRELRFNINVPCKYFTEDELRLEGLTDQTVLVQGVIDCIIEYPDGSFGVFDYKTDRLTRDELESRALAQARMSARHRRQLEYYALAVEEIFGKKPTRVEVYSLHFGDTLSIGL